MPDNKTPVFISWSGKRSKAAAEAFRDWLPRVLQAIDPWMSESDIPPGAKWSDQLSDSLSKANFAILCVTPDNVNSPWLLFEAGALAKQLNETDLCPVLFDIEPAQLKGPLAQFQAVKATRDGIWKLIGRLNELSNNPVRDDHLLDAVEKWWPELDSKLSTLPPQENATAAPARSEMELLQEVLEHVREIARRERPHARELGDWLAFIHREFGKAGINVQSVQAVYSRMPPPPDEPRLVRIKDNGGREYKVRLDLSASPSTIMKSIQSDLKNELKAHNS